MARLKSLSPLLDDAKSSEASPVNFSGVFERIMRHKILASDWPFAVDGTPKQDKAEMCLLKLQSYSGITRSQLMQGRTVARIRGG